MEGYGWILCGERDFAGVGEVEEAYVKRMV